MNGAGMRIDATQVLREIATLRNQVIREPAQTQATAQGITETSERDAFGALLSRSVQEVNDLQQRAVQLAEDFERGTPQVSLVEVMLATQKAGLAFQAMTEVRNQMVRAYQDIMNMPV